MAGNPEYTSIISNLSEKVKMWGEWGLREMKKFGIIKVLLNNVEE